MQDMLVEAKGEKQLVTAMSRAGAASEELAALRGKVAPELEDLASGLSEDYAALAQASQTREPVQESYELIGIINAQVELLADTCDAEMIAPQ